MTEEADIYCVRCGSDLSDADFWQLSECRAEVGMPAPTQPVRLELCDLCKRAFDRFLDPAGVVR